MMYPWPCVKMSIANIDPTSHSAPVEFTLKECDMDFAEK